MADLPIYLDPATALSTSGSASLPELDPNAPPPPDPSRRQLKTMTPLFPTSHWERLLAQTTYLGGSLIAKIAWPIFCLALLLLFAGLGGLAAIAYLRQEQACSALDWQSTAKILLVLLTFFSLTLTPLVIIPFYFLGALQRNTELRRLCLIRFFTHHPPFAVLPRHLFRLALEQKFWYEQIFMSDIWEMLLLSAAGAGFYYGYLTFPRLFIFAPLLIVSLPAVWFLDHLAHFYAAYLRAHRRQISADIRPTAAGDSEATAIYDPSGPLRRLRRFTPLTWGFLAFIIVGVMFVFYSIFNGG